MTTEYSINVDWLEEYKEHPDRWINHGRDILRNSCKHKDGVEKNDWCEECDISEDSAEPMMNYAYPLHHEPEEEEILRVVKETSLTIMENQDSGEWFLGLCAGGMDLSQSIGYAYLICGYIPDAMAFNISSQYGLTKSGKKYFELMKAVIDSLEGTREAYKNKIERIREEVKEAKAKET